MTILMYVFFSIFLIFALLCFLLNHRRKACMIKKVCSMPQAEKCQMLNELIQPLGYHYLLCQDIFFSTFDAWQREFGYTHSYDCLAPYFNMVFDSEPVYFDYDNRTWLIELWKGQYGINTGAEIGIYCADSIIPPQKRNRELFHTIADEEIPLFSMKLKRNVNLEEQHIANLSMPHWWLAAFRMGCFSQAANLSADFCISFFDCGMMHAFADALIRLGYDAQSLQICGSRICFSYRTPMSPVPCGFLTKLVRYAAQWKNRFFCRLYLFVTRPFHCTLDRLLYLYFYLPFIFRHCLRLRRCRKHSHKCRKHSRNKKKKIQKRSSSSSRSRCKGGHL